MPPGGFELDHVDLDVHKTLAGVETQIRLSAGGKDQGDEYLVSYIRAVSLPI